MVGCQVLTGTGETASGAAKLKWTPKTKPGTSTGTLGLPLSETPSRALSGELTVGLFSPLALTGSISETFIGGTTCGEAVGSNARRRSRREPSVARPSHSTRPTLGWPVPRDTGHRGCLDRGEALHWTISASMLSPHYCMRATGSKSNQDSGAFGEVSSDVAGAVWSSAT